MKKGLIAIAMLATLALSACGGGKPDLDDPKSIAKYRCEKMKEMMGMMSDPVANASKIEALGNEVDAVEKEFKEHHGDKVEEMEGKVEEALKTECADLANSF